VGRQILTFAALMQVLLVDGGMEDDVVGGERIGLEQWMWAVQARASGARLARCARARALPDPRLPPRRSSPRTRCTLRTISLCSRRCGCASTRRRAPAAAAAPPPPPAAAAVPPPPAPPPLARFHRLCPSRQAAADVFEWGEERNPGAAIYVGEEPLRAGGELTVFVDQVPRCERPHFARTERAPAAPPRARTPDARRGAAAQRGLAGDGRLRMGRAARDAAVAAADGRRE